MSYDDDFGDEKEFRMDVLDDDIDPELGEDMEGMHLEEEEETDPDSRFT